MNQAELINFFENQDFLIHISDEGAELETWTEGGVNMFIGLFPFTKESFFEAVEAFDIDEEIEVHRQDASYKAAFKIAQSVEDFTKFLQRLRLVAKKLKEN